MKNNSFKYNGRLDFIYKINVYECSMRCHSHGKGDPGCRASLKLYHDKTFQLILRYSEIQCTREADFSFDGFSGKKNDQCLKAMAIYKNANKSHDSIEHMLCCTYIKRRENCRESGSSQTTAKDELVS